MSRIAATAFTFVLALVLAAGADRADAQALVGAPPPKTELQLALAKIESVPRLLAMGRKLEAEGKWADYQHVMQRVLELRPFAGNIKVELAAAYAMQDKKSEAYDILVRMQSAGYGYDIAGDDRFALIRETGVWKYVSEGFAANGKDHGTGRVAFTLPAEDLLIESVTWDANRSAFLTGSVRTGTVYTVSDKGELKAFIAPDDKNGLLGVFDLAADAAHDTLWVAGAGIPHVKHAKGDDYGRGGLWKFKLSTGEFLGKWLVTPDGKNHMIASIAVNPAGQPFVADHATAQVFTLVGEELRLIVQNPKLLSIRAIAPTADNKSLLFADHELGLFGLDLATGRAFDIASGPEVTLFGIESMYWSKGALVAVQNGIVPRRTVRFDLTDDLRLVKRSQMLDANRPAFAAMTRGTVVDDKLYFVANSQKSQYDGYGVPKDAKKLEGARIFVSDASLGRNVPMAPPRKD